MGFTLTEVMIGMAILAIAIVSATNLLVGLITANRNNTEYIQAYYLAQEGIEAVRNIRDTNWMHNADFMAGVVFQPFRREYSYFIELDQRGWQDFFDDDSDINAFLPWNVEEKGRIVDAEENPYDGFALNFEENIDKQYGIIKGPAVFYRHINILPYENCEEDDCKNFFVAQSVVNFKDGSNERNVTLEAVFSDWKGGAL